MRRHVRDLLAHIGVVRDKSHERRLVDDDGAERSGRVCDSFERNRRAERIADCHRLLNPEPFDQGEQIGGVLFRRSGHRCSSALRVAATVVAHDLVLARECRDDRIPIVMVSPRSVHQDDRGTSSFALVEELESVY